jgi:very-short-patch-repair endonuclease
MTNILNNKNLQSKRRNLRKKMTFAEVALWCLIKNKQLDDVRFLRQYSVGNYIVDFYTPQFKLAIELDGEGHFDEKQIFYDNKRTEFLNSLGIKVLRFENFEVIDYPQRTLDEIRKYLV